MKPTKSQWIAAGFLFVLALGFLVAGVWGFVLRGQPATAEAMLRMRNYAVLRTAAGAIVNEIYLQAKLDAREYARAQKFSRNQITVYMDEQGELARKAAEEKHYNTQGIDRSELSVAVESFEASLSGYSRLEAAEKDAYAEIWREQQAALAAQDASEETVGAKVGAISEDAMMAPAVQKVDYSGFVPSAELNALSEALTPAYDAMYGALETALPDLEPEMKDKLREPLIMVVRGGENGFNVEYDSYAATGAEGAFEGAEKTRMTVTRQAANLMMLALGVLVAALTVLYYRPIKRSLGMPRLVITAFFLLLCILASLYNINVAGMFSTVLWRTGMYGVLALAMLPGIQAGISLNMGMTVGIIAGLISTLVALEYNMSGWGAFFFSVIGGILLALPTGLLYGKLLNRLKGSEMTVSTYVGFSIVSLFCIAWMLLPFKNPKLTWALGSGLRTMHNMGDSFGQLLDGFLAFDVLGVHVPTGLLLFFLLCCFIMWLFSRSRTGIAMIAGGANHRFAEAAGVNVNNMRIIGTTISTVIAAVGIIVYSQSFGFMQLYNGPKQMGFVAASAILIGGATVTRAKVSHVIIGTFLFQGVLALGIQVANAAIAEGGLSEVMRILISNGIILYALTQSGGEGRG
jgi:simple sugar transport system permease protein